MIIFERIIFEHPELGKWNLGFPFLNKFEFVHNYEKETIGFYIPYEEEEEKKEEKEEKKEKNEEDEEADKKDKNAEKNNEDPDKKYIVIIIIGIIVAIILMIAAFLIGKNMYQNRRHRVNELKDEDFDYSATNNEKQIN